MNRNNHNTIRTFRNKALVGAIVAALALGAAGSATAQSTSSYTLSTTWAQTLELQNFLHSVNNTQTLNAAVNATIANGHLFYDGDGTGSPSTVNDNSIHALAAGNDASGTASATNPNDKAGNSIDLGLLGADATLNSGLGILSGQLNNADVVGASVADSGITTALTNHTTGAVTESNDTISANTQINNASNSIAGQLPTAAFTGSTAGSTEAVQPRQSNSVPSTFGADGDIVVGNVQANANNTSSATVTNSVVQVTDTAAGTVSADFTNSQNTIQAGFSGNSAGNAFNAQSGGAVSYAGSVVVGNAQLNDAGNGSATISSSNNNTVIGGAGNFTGTVSQSGNRMLAGAQGNSADNSITFADGISLAGDGGTASLPLVYKYSTRTSQPAASADLSLLNSQTNDGSSFSSSISNSDMRATVNAVGAADAAVTLDDNTVLASAGANASSNALRASGASFADSVAVGNLQANNIAPTSASINGSRLQATMSAGTRNSLGDVSVSGNQIGSSAAGNAAHTSVDLAGTSFNSGAGVVAAQVGVNVVGASTDALDTGGAGINVGNLQINKAGSDVSASTANAHILAEFPGNNVIGGATTVDGNAVSASAFASDATTSVALSGANGVLSASLGSFQDTESNTSASVSMSDIGLGIGFAPKNASDTTLTVSNSSMTAGATANRNSNALSTDFTNATLGAGGAFAAASNSINHNVTWFGSNKGHAALDLLSNQYVNGDVTAEIIQGTFGTNILGNASDSAITTSGNSVGASATANSVVNTLDPGVGTLSTDNGSAAQIATLGNVQTAATNDVSASVGVPRSGFVGRIVTQVHEDLSGSEVSVSDNDVSAFAGGNMASNGMAVTGSNFAPTAVGGTNGQSNFDGTTANVWAAWAEQSLQNSIGGSRSATIDTGSIGATVGGSITSSPLTVDGNTVGTDARDNYASNGLSLSGFSALDTTAALQSVQNSAATLTSSVSNTSIGAGTPNDSMTGSALTVAGNQMSAKALANTVFSTLQVQAGQLSGNGNGGQRGANADLAGLGATVLADYGLANDQDRTGAVGASIIGGSVADGLIGGGADGNVNGGSMTVSGNGVTALAQSNSGVNTVALTGTSVDASAALLSVQNVGAASNASASIVATEGFVAYAGGSLGASLTTPVTVSGNNLVAQAGQNEATNALTVGATSAIAGDGTGAVGADNSAFQDAIADYALYNGQNASSGSTASVTPGLSGIEVGGAIGNAGNALTVNDNGFAASASANSASNALSLTGAASITASAALNNTQSAAGGSISASTSGAQVGIFDDSGANVRNASLTVSGNSVSAQASGNSAGNTVQNLPVALNAGNPEFTSGQAGTALNSERALANNALLNVQNNADTISATISGGSIGVNPTAGVASPLLTSSAMVGGNTASAFASGNSASNAIQLASLSTGVSSSALVSNQLNSANVGATVSSMQIGVTAGGNSTSPVTVTGNTVGATAIGNSAMNHIGIGN